MSKSASHHLTIQAEVTTAAVRTQLVDVHGTGPTDVVMMERDAYWLDLCLTPRALNARACYRDHWSANRFKRLGKIFLLPPGETIHARDDGGPTQSCVVCHIPPKLMLQSWGGDRQWTERQLEASLDIPGEAIRTQLLRLAQELQHPGFASEMLVELITAQLALELGRYLFDFQELPPEGALTTQRLRTIDERLEDFRTPPTLVELAALCDISVRQLTRGFRASRGCSIGDYIARNRIDLAKRLLAGEQRIKGIAHWLGFASPSSFCAAFRRATGSAPREFRRQATRGLRRDRARHLSGAVEAD